jgi:cobalt-zinc-cadmium resistance protein CzcA
VSRGIFFAAAIIIVSFLPLFTLTGVEGHIFGPMAKTYAYAIFGGLIATFTVAPALSAMLLPDKLSEVETFVVSRMRRSMSRLPPLPIATRSSRWAAASCWSSGPSSASVRSASNSCRIWKRATSISAPRCPVRFRSKRASRRRAIRRDIMQNPEVLSVLSAHGRPDDGTDATGFFNIEYFVPLKPFDEWPRGMDKEKLVAELSKKLRDKYPGVDFSFSQIIEDNVEEAASG